MEEESLPQNQQGIRKYRLDRKKEDDRRGRTGREDSARDQRAARRGRGVQLRTGRDREKSKTSWYMKF